LKEELKENEKRKERLPESSQVGKVKRKSLGFGKTSLTTSLQVIFLFKIWIQKEHFLLQQKTKKLV
jgi:hypothetical protein